MNLNGIQIAPSQGMKTLAAFSLLSINKSSEKTKPEPDPNPIRSSYKSRKSSGRRNLPSHNLHNRIAKFTGRRIFKLRSDIEQLKSLYHFMNPAEVIEFLEDNPSLYDLLKEAYSKVKIYFGPSTKMSLEVTHDPEGEDSSELFVRVNTSLSAKDAWCILDRLDNEWWFDASSRADDLMNITLEYV